MNFSINKLLESGYHKATDEVVYSNIASIVVSFSALIVSLILFRSYGWITPTFVAFGVALFVNLTLLFNYFGFTTIGRLYLSILPPLAIIAGDILTLTNIPDGSHSFSFDIRVLILGAAVLPVLLFTIKEQVYIYAGLLVYCIVLFFFDQLHSLFNIHLDTSFGKHYYISTYFYVIAFLFIVITLLIFKIRWCKLSKSYRELLSELERKVESRTNELERNSEELIKKNNELEQFSFTVSHNVRGPVARLLGLTYLYDKVDSKEQQLIAKQIQTTTASLDAIISDLNSILQVRNNLYKIKEYVEIRPEIKHAQQLLADSNQNICCLKNMIIDIKHEKIFGIKPYIQSILFNLIGNAFKYKKEGVDLQVRVFVKLINDKILIQISDNGRGIDLNKFGNKIFTMYTRFDLDKPGKGLGLYLVKKQVDAMNGTIEVKSKLNKGTTFSILLPYPSPSKIKYQKYYKDDTVSILYDAVNLSSLVSWSKNPTSSEFRNLLIKNIKSLTVYRTSYWINDTTYFGSLTVENQQWFNDKIIPKLLKLGLKAIIIVNKEGKGFKSSQWNLLKIACSKNKISLGFKYSIEEALEYISTLQARHQIHR